MRFLLDPARALAFSLCQTAPYKVIASIVAERCLVELTSEKFLEPELYLDSESRKGRIDIDNDDIKQVNEVLNIRMSINL